jgi:hypothetical protein
MGMLQNVNPPNLPIAEATYSKTYFDKLNNVLRLFFGQINAVQTLSLAGLNIDPNTLPTQASLANLRVGDVYVDTSAGNVLKVKL